MKETIYESQNVLVNKTFEYETNIPCEWFNVVEDGELYCKGFVFNINDLKG